MDVHSHTKITLDSQPSQLGRGRSRDLRGRTLRHADGVPVNMVLLLRE